MSHQEGMGGVWVLGTDTGVGKTKVSAGLVYGLASRGVRVAGLKPVVSGALDWMGAPAGQPQVWEDLLALEQAGGVVLSPNRRSILALQAPASPHFAAQEQGVQVDFAALLAGIRDVAADVEMVVVEGVGGLRVPLTARFDTADLAVALGLPVVLVVGLRLGCINHALLTAEALRSRGLTIATWVANTGLSEPYARVDETVATISARLGVPCSAVLPPLAPLPLLQWAQRQSYLLGLKSQAVEAAAALQGTLDVLLCGGRPGCFT